MLFMTPQPKGRKAMSKTLGVRLPDALLRELEAAAEEDRRKVSDLVRVLLEDALAARKGGKGK
jgi:metal-responsive CopG/Arc/MetJ family transcriptional regulator